MKMYKFANTAVAATSFFTGEKEIFDFVFERVKRCIAAKKLQKHFIQPFLIKISTQITVYIWELANAGSLLLYISIPSLCTSSRT